MRVKRWIFLALGFLCLLLGCIGVLLPVLPTVPLFLATVFCFANSSEKLHNWFIHTGLYKKHLESFVQKRGMTVQTKLGIMISVTLVMGLGFFLMLRGGIFAPAVILAVVWVCHIVYFVFGVKTIEKGEKEKILT